MPGFPAFAFAYSIPIYRSRELAGLLLGLVEEVEACHCASTGLPKFTHGSHQNHLCPQSHSCRRDTNAATGDDEFAGSDML